MPRISSRMGLRAAKAAGFVWALLLGAGLAACGEEGSYRLSWSLESGPIESARDCTGHGIGTIRVTAFDAGGGKRVAEFHCWPPEAEGPGLPDGTYDLQVEALRLDGGSFEDPITGQHYGVAWVRGLEVVSGRKTPAEVILPVPPGCLDGVDNDEDGLVDAADPDCWARDDSGAVIRDEQGQVTWVPQAQEGGG